MFELLIQSIKNHIVLTDAEADLICAALQVKKIRKNQLLVEPPDYCKRERVFYTFGSQVVKSQTAF